MTRREEIVAQLIANLSADSADLSLLATDEAIDQRVAWLTTLAVRGGDIEAQAKTWRGLVGLQPSAALTGLEQDVARLLALLSQIATVAKEVRLHAAEVAAESST